MNKIKVLCLFALVFSATTFAQDTLQEVNLKANERSLKQLKKPAANTYVMTKKELLKAACCNLAESFDTNPVIDVAFADALTGARQIKMLGLTSPYLTITEENIPSVRGASQAFGLSFTPGTWIQSIQITKGAGSVVNGFESISGQINTELLKPFEAERFFVNFYGSSDARFELNTHVSQTLSQRWKSLLLVHGNARVVQNDMNHDGFLDNPTGQQVNILNRYQYTNNEKGVVGFFTFRYLNDQKIAGQKDFRDHAGFLHDGAWGSEINTQRFDASTKVGYVFPDMPFQSIGFQNAFSYHNQEGFYGLNQYGISQTNFYSNLIFNSIISNTLNKFATGLSFNFDQYGETVRVPNFVANPHRIDTSVGAFFEYTYDNTDDFSVVAGARVDYHNRLGVFATPRLHARYNPWEGGTLRVSAGRGKRIANIFAENQQFLASNRIWNVASGNGEIYGLDPEIAWNYGFSYSQSFKLFKRSANIGADIYRTDFQQQVVIDPYRANELSVQMLQGNSFVNAVQLDFSINILTHLNLRTSYKYYDMKTDFASGANQRPLQAKHRFFVNGEFSTHEHENGSRWKFDATYNWLGSQVLPTTTDLPQRSAAFGTLNTQVTRVFSKVFEVYGGIENATNFRQPQVISGANDPFGNNFDASVVYGPVFGRMYYAGLRFKIN